MTMTSNSVENLLNVATQAALEAGLIDANTFDDGIKGLYRTTAEDGVFCYTFFKAVATKP